MQAVHTRDVYISLIYPLHYFDQLSQLIMFNWFNLTNLSYL